MVTASVAAGAGRSPSSARSSSSSSGGHGPEGDAGAGSRRSRDDAQLRIGPGQHGHVLPGQALGAGLSQFGGDAQPPRRPRTGRSAGSGEGRPAGWNAPGGAGLATEHGGGGRHHLRAGTVVVVQADDLGLGPALREVGQEARVGAVPTVDGLVGVAHHEQVLVIPEQRQQQPALEGVDVLELVDEDVLPAPPLGRGEAPVGLEGVGVARQEVVEVDQPAPAFLVFVTGVQGADGLGVGRELPARLLGGGGERSRRHQAGLGPLHLAGQVGDAHVLQAGPPGGQFGYQPALAGQQRRLRGAPVGPPAP